jgi:hypothetical protein
MYAIQSCPWYVDTVGGITPPLVIVGVVAIPLLAVSGRRLVAAIGDPHASLAAAQVRNVTLGLLALLFVLALVITAWLMLNYPGACYQWTPSL